MTQSAMLQATIALLVASLPLHVAAQDLSLDAGVSLGVSAGSGTDGNESLLGGAGGNVSLLGSAGGNVGLREGAGGSLDLDGGAGAGANVEIGVALSDATVEAVGSTAASASGNLDGLILGNGQPAATLIGMVVYSSDGVALGVVRDIAGFDGANLQLGLMANASLGLSQPVVVSAPVESLTQGELHLSATATEFLQAASS